MDVHGQYMYIIGKVKLSAARCGGHVFRRAGHNTR